jgi:hypothetical protein
MLDTLIAAVERDDADAVCEFISPTAEELRQYAQASMPLASVSGAKYHDLEIKVNNAAVPSNATVHFSAVFFWKNKFPIEGILLDRPIPESGQVEVELVKTRSEKSKSWQITKLQHPFPTRFR